MKNEKLKIGKLEVRGLRVDFEGKEDAYTPAFYISNEDADVIGRRAVAAWNYCAGVPTAELESQGADAGFWGRSCARLSNENSILKVENAAVRAAVREMERMLKPLEWIERENPATWIYITEGTGIATLNAYRQTLENAMAKMNQP